MRELEILMNPNKLVQHLKKPASEFTRYDIINYIEDKNIETMNFRYVGEDGKLKELNFVITGKNYLESVFATGERVDGSSLFSNIEAGSSDLYVIPRFNTAFENPFTEKPTLEIMCSFYTRDGEPLQSAPEYILRKAYKHFRTTGYDFKAMGELEYYVISEKTGNYPSINQKGYHESSPFTKWGGLRIEAMRLIAACGGKIKYGHSEVGNFETDTHYYEQHEIEFMPVHPEQAVEQLIIGKWILRNLSVKYGVKVSFAPKITEGKAGSGLHIHMQVEKEGENLIADKKGLTDIAKKTIAGLLKRAGSLTAFGNTIPTSYLRLVPDQEAPTMICWGSGNRSVLVRVPLGWLKETNMIKDANPQELSEIPYINGKQTVEIRVPDGSADLYMLMAGIVCSVRDGLTADDSLKTAEDLYVDVNIFDKKNNDILKKLKALPSSCCQSADYLENDREFYENAGVFPPSTISNIISKLKSYNDSELNKSIKEKKIDVSEIVEKYLHCR